MGSVKKSTLLITGPVATGALVAVLFMTGALNPTLLVPAMAAAALLWSPLPVSLAAVICNEERAAAGSGMGFAKKAFYLYPRMWREHRSVTESHLLGFSVLVVALLLAIAI